MAYKKYKVIKSPKEFWSTWDKEQLDNLTPLIKGQIYLRYTVKCIVFQRDNFRCQNENCKSPHSKITFHHIKFQKNEGKDKPRNCITICNSCQQRFHEGRNSLTFWGMTYKVDKQKQGFNWKEFKTKAKIIRKNNKKDHGITISLELIEILIRFLEIDFTRLYEDD